MCNYSTIYIVFSSSCERYINTLENSHALTFHFRDSLFFPVLFQHQCSRCESLSLFVSFPFRVACLKICHGSTLNSEYLQNLVHCLRDQRALHVIRTKFENLVQ